MAQIHKLNHVLSKYPTGIESAIILTFSELENWTYSMMPSQRLPTKVLMVAGIPHCTQKFTFPRARLFKERVE